MNHQEVEGQGWRPQRGRVLWAALPVPLPQAARILAVSLQCSCRAPVLGTKFETGDSLQRLNGRGGPRAPRTRHSPMASRFLPQLWPVVLLFIWCFSLNEHTFLLSSDLSNSNPRNHDFDLLIIYFIFINRKILKQCSTLITKSSPVSLVGASPILGNLGPHTEEQEPLSPLICRCLCWLLPVNTVPDLESPSLVLKEDRHHPTLIVHSVSLRGQRPGNSSQSLLIPWLVFGSIKWNCLETQCRNLSTNVRAIN